MRLPFASAFVLALLGACGGELTSNLAITSIEPGFGPLAGGSRIVIRGAGFLAGGAPPNRVLFGDREAPLASAIDDRTLEVVIPPGTAAGAVDVIVFNDLGTTESAGAFRYSTEPVASNVAPDLLRYDEGGTVTITGSGFVEENAGVVTVTIDGKKALDLEVLSDTQLRFAAPPGKIFTRADIVIENRRGRASLRGYQYGPGPQGGLVIFPNSNTQVFLWFFDPLTLEVIDVPRRDPMSPNRGFRTVFRDEQNRLVGLDHQDNVLYQIDLVEQALTRVSSADSYSSVVRVGNTFYAVFKRNDPARFGTFNLATGALNQLSTFQCCPGGVAMAADSTGILYQTRNDTIQTINRTTGAAGAPVTMTPPARVSAMRFIGNTLFAFNRNQNSIITINPTTGATDVVVANLGINAAGIEVVP